MANTPKSNDKPDNDNRSRQLNPEHDAYWRSRGEEGAPEGGGEAPPPKPAPGEGGRKPG
jgi:hypothetical protein